MGQGSGEREHESGTGFDVPPGFVVTTSAYAAFAERLRAEITARLASLGADNVAEVADRIQAVIRAAVVPESVWRRAG